MKDKILTEITDFCENCLSHECCHEEECVLFRIEQILLDKEDKTETVEEGQLTIFDVSNS